jgi:hypothetical protein
MGLVIILLANPFKWEAQFLERGELLYARGGFVTRALAVQWAEAERNASLSV